METHASSLVQWQGKSVSRALAQLKPLLKLRPVSSELPSRVSDPATKALMQLSSDVKRLGIPPGVRLPVVENLMRAFVEKARGLDWASAADDRAAGQAAFDLAFLLRLSGVSASELTTDATVSSLLDRVSLLTQLTVRGVLADTTGALGVTGKARELSRGTPPPDATHPRAAHATPPRHSCADAGTQRRAAPTRRATTGPREWHRVQVAHRRCEAGQALRTAVHCGVSERSGPSNPRGERGERGELLGRRAAARSAKVGARSCPPCRISRHISNQ